MEGRRCIHCATSLDHLRVDAETCGTRCRVRVARRRGAGLRPDAFNSERGAARGRVPLTGQTRSELRARWRLKLLELGVDERRAA